MMRICHVVSADPYSYIGGTPIVVKSLREHMKSDYIYCRGKFFFIRGFIYSFIIALWLVLKRYDVVVVHDPAGYGYSFVPRFMRSKMIAVNQGVWTDFGEMVNLTTLQKIKTRIAIHMQKRMLRKCDHVITYCKYVEGRLIRDYGIKKGKLTIICNGVDTKKFKPSGRHNKKLAIWVSDNTVIKQLDTAINYANNKGMKLMVVGLNGKSTENVEYFGKVPHEKMPEMYNKAGTFVMFISMPAPPLVLLEAMACGLNTITSDVEIIPKGRDGLCRVKAKDARKLALYYDWNKVAKRHLDVYEKVFGGFVS